MLPPAVMAAAIHPASVVVRVAVRHAYDGNGNVVKRTDGNGVETLFGYDEVNRLISIDYPGGASPDISFTYDANGNRTRMADATGTTVYEYDLFDRLTGITYPNGNFVTYGYDHVGNITDLKYGNESALAEDGEFTHIHYQFDPDNRIASVENVFAKERTAYEYDAAGNPARRVLPNGVATAYGYDADGRFTSIAHRKSNGELLCQYDYTLNAIGNRTRVVETTPKGARVTSYTYDPLDRLDTVTYPDGRFVDYDYDSFGNRTRMLEKIGGTQTVRVYTYDTDSRLLSTTLNGASEEEFHYDATGNLIQRYRLTDRRLIDYVYDFENRLIRYYDGIYNVEYAYNGVGERVCKIANGERTDYLNDPNRQYVQVLAETDADGLAKRVYRWGNELISQETSAGGGQHFYLQDGSMGSVRRLIDFGGETANAYEYDAFGRPTLKLERVPNDYQFDSEAQDDETELIFLRKRFCAVDLGRFTVRDSTPGSAKNPQSQNQYAFVSQNPVNMIDPSGNSGEWLETWTSLPLNVFGATRSAGTAPKSLREEEHIGGYVFYDPSIRGTFIETSIRIHELVHVVQHDKGLWPGRITRAAAETQADLAELNYLSGTAYASTPYADKVFGRYLSHSAQVVREATRPLRDSLSTTTDLRTLSQPLNSSFAHPGGVALNKTAEVLLNISKVSGATYDPATGQILLFGRDDQTPTALPPMGLDDLAVAFRAVSKGTMPVVSIEDPVVGSPAEWPGRDAFTVRYGPFYTDPVDGKSKVLDVSSKTHFGWVMFEADRLMKCLSLGVDNRTTTPVTSRVPGYLDAIDLSFKFENQLPQRIQTRFWFNPKEIVIEPSADGHSMELKKAEMQLSTETMFASNGQVESTPDAEYFARWFTDNYDAIANEQLTKDDTGKPHHIFKELKQLAALVGVVKWAQENQIPLDWSFLDNYTPQDFDSAPSYTPVITVTGTRENFFFRRSWEVTGGVNYCNDLDLDNGGNPAGLALSALSSRSSETNLAWNFQHNGVDYRVAAVSVDRKEKDGGFSHSAVDAAFQVNGASPLVLGRHFDSFNIVPTLFGWGWQAQPYALEFKSSRTKFNLCARQWEGYGEVYFHDRAGQAAYQFVPSGIYDRDRDPLLLAGRFDSKEDILVYRYETKETPGLLFTDGQTRFTMRRADGTLLDFDLTGRLLRTEDRHRNQIEYRYRGKWLVGIGQPGGREMTFIYDAQGRVIRATLPGGHLMRYTYDARGNLVTAQREAPIGQKVQYTYNSDHCLEEILDENGQSVAGRTYDVYGRVASVTQPGVSTPIIQKYSLAQRTTEITGPESLSQFVRYNERYDPVSITDARGGSVKLAYNRFRNVTREERADGRTYRHFYDARGNRIGLQHPNGRVDLTFLDLQSNPVVTFHSSVDADFEASFDADQTLVSYKGGAYAANETTYDYDTDGNLIALVDANSHTNHFGYDGLGNRIWSRDARGRQTEFTYDAFSRLTRVRNALGHAAEYAYDERDNNTVVETKAGTVRKSYNAKNQLVRVTTGDLAALHTTTYTYDARGQIKTVADPNGFLTEYSYDPRGNLSEIKHAGAVRFSYSYDALNRLTTTEYSGTSGGAKPSLIPVTPRGGDSVRGDVSITWQSRGDWTAQPNLRIQYSRNGTDWVDIATVHHGSGEYQWRPDALAENALQIRFLRPGDPDLRATTPTFQVRHGGEYFVNDSSTQGDEFCRAAGRPYNATTVTGLTPDDPVDNLQAILDHYILGAGDIVHVDVGNYSIAHDIVITATDSGQTGNPVVITGPARGGKAVIRHSDRSHSTACLVLEEATAVTVEHLTLTGAANGISLFNSIDCILRANECYDNGVDGAPGQSGDGAGIRVLGQGRNLLDRNVCHHNGGDGGAGNAQANQGGSGRGYGIAIESSSFNEARNNECHHNGGMGGLAFSAAAASGDTIAGGVLVQTIDPAVTAHGNRMIGNTCHHHEALAPDDDNAARIPAGGGNAWAYGIRLVQTEDSLVEGNSLTENLGWGGRSWNEAAGGMGGSASAFGLYAEDATGVTIGNNVCGSNAAVGEFGGDNLTDGIGAGWAAGIYLRGCSGAVVKNNLCYLNRAGTYGRFGREPKGSAYCSGIELEHSPRSTIVNNTLFQNHAFVEELAGGTQEYDPLVAQVYLWRQSTNTAVLNNIFEAALSDSACLHIEPDSQRGFASDYNLFWLQDGAFAGFWGVKFCQTLADWQQAALQDTHSIAAQPRFYSITGRDFHLRGDSPAIDTGLTVDQVQADADGEVRPAPGKRSQLAARQDIGCDEYTDSDADGLSDLTEKTITLTSPDDPDSDRDGLPDGWEAEFGLLANDATGLNGADGDPDRDGSINREEWLEGSSPTDATSVPDQNLVLTSISPASSDLLLLEGESIRFAVNARAAAGEVVEYSWVFDGVEQSQAAQWVFTASHEASGLGLVKQSVVDLRVSSADRLLTNRWNLVIKNRNRPPVLQVMTNQIVKAGETVRLAPVYSDPDNENSVVGDDNVLSLAYSGWMTNATRAVTAADLGAHRVTITVSDNGDPPLSVTLTLDVTVLSSLLEFSRIEVKPGGTVAITLRTEPGQTNWVETSADLRTWYTLTNSVSAGEAISMLDLVPPGDKQRFYRARLLRSNPPP